MHESKMGKEGLTKRLETEESVRSETDWEEIFKGFRILYELPVDSKEYDGQIDNLGNLLYKK